MNLLKRKLVLVLKDIAYSNMKRLDPFCPCAKALKTIDVENSLEEDIASICDVVSFAETTKIISFIVQLKTPIGKNEEIIKNELKKLGELIVKRAEEKSGKLKIPKTCRSLLMDL